MKLVQVKSQDKVKYEKFLNSMPETTCMQMWEWAEFRNKLGRKIYKRLGVVDNEGNYQLGASYAINSFKLFGNVLYIPQGPVWKSPEALEFFSREIIKIAKKNNCFAVIAAPRVKRKNHKFEHLEDSNFKLVGKSVQPKETVFIDLTKGKDDLLASFSKSARYNVRCAKRKGVEIRKYHSPEDVDRIDEFYNLLIATQKRNYFFVQPKKYFQVLWKEFSKNRHIVLYEAYVKGEHVHSLLVLNTKRWAGSLFSSSSRKYSKYKATYLTRWESIVDAKGKGCEIYDFFGATSSKDRSHPFYYTTRFKLGFGSEVVQFPGTFEIILCYYKYRIWRIAQKVGLFKFYQSSYLKEFRKKHEKN